LLDLQHYVIFNMHIQLCCILAGGLQDCINAVQFVTYSVQLLCLPAPGRQML